MPVLTVITKLLWRLLALSLVLVLAYVLWALIAYRDIPMAELEARYGGDRLQRLEFDGVSLACQVG